MHVPSRPQPPYPDVDRHVRRTGDDYAIALAELLPRGQAWPRLDTVNQEDESILIKVVRGLAEIYGLVDSRAADLLERESDPRITIELLPDWERAWGLPEKCWPIPGTIGERQFALVRKMTLLGRQDRDFFIDLATQFGAVITIEEYAPYMCGISRTGDTGYENTLAGGLIDHPRWVLGQPEIRFYWSVHIGGVRLTWLRCGAGICGVDHMLEMDIPQDLQCVLDLLKPAQTDIVFDYTIGTGITNIFQGIND